MKATEASLLPFLKKSPQFLVPIYQRAYNWREDQCRQLWDDILRAGRGDAIDAHFIGSVVYIEKGLYQVMGHTPLLVIDGQQRLTTVSLIIEVLARALGDDEPLDGFSARKLRNYYLLNPDEDGERRYKLLLSQTDKETFTALLDSQPEPREHSLRVSENFKLFSGWIGSVKGDLATVCKGLAKLMIVDISLTREHDNPQLIFESLNSTGLELSQADLIRNFVLMELEPVVQERLYKQYWRPMEVDFGQVAYSSHFDAFMRHYLTLKTGDIPNVGEVYQAFKNYARSPRGGGEVEALLADLRSFAGYFNKMALGAEQDPDLAVAFQDFRELAVDVAYPFLLELYHDFSGGILAKQELLEAVRLIESYVFRRAVCSIPTNSLNKTFATFGRALRKDGYLESIQAHFLLLPSYRRFPSDDEFKSDLQARDLYNFRNRSYWLRRLENYGRKERVTVDEYTIEHIMPQNENLREEWRDALGPEWQRVHQTYLNSVGNLTLTGYNSEYSDRPFIEKRDMEGGFAHSPLRLNESLRSLATWNEDTIRERGRMLADQATKVWTAPKLDRAVLEEYEPRRGTANWTISDHPYLMRGPMQEIFEAFRKQVLALDPCVSEEFLKFYVAYKAETNFVDVVPQAKRLRLSLNIGFHEMDDPRGICRDVSGLGRWGNGHVEVGLSTLEELPYVMGLVRQSFERQMGSTAAE